VRLAIERSLLPPACRMTLRARPPCAPCSACVHSFPSRHARPPRFFTLEEFSGRAFVGLVDGSFAYLTDSGLRRFFPTRNLPLGLSGDGRFVAVGGPDRLDVWDAESGLRLGP
jgi:hypothetical protein